MVTKLKARGKTWEERDSWDGVLRRSVIVLLVDDLIRGSHSRHESDL